MLHNYSHNGSRVRQGQEVEIEVTKNLLCDITGGYHRYFQKLSGLHHFIFSSYLFISKKFLLTHISIVVA